MNPVLDQFNYILKQQGIDITINGVISSKCLMKEKENADYNDRKQIYVTIGQVRQGDVIDFLGETWIVVSKDIGSQVYDVLNLELTKHIIRFNFEGEIITFPAITHPMPKVLDDGAEVSFYAGTLQITLQETQDSEKIVLGQRVLNQGQAWKVSGWDKSKRGLITLMCEVDVFNADDDKVNEIADRFAYMYEVTIDKANSEQNVGYTATLNATVTLNSNVVAEDIEWASSDESIGTIDQSGNITLVGVGEVTFTATMTRLPDYFGAVTFTVVEVPVEPEYIISPSTSSLLQGSSETYSVFKYIDGVQQADTFTIAGSNVPELNYTIEVFDDNTFKVTNNQAYSSNDLTVTATCIDGANVSINIKLKGFW